MYTNRPFALKRKEQAYRSFQKQISPRWWTAEQLAYLEANLLTQTKIEIGKAIGKSEKAVSKKMWELRRSY